MAFVYREAKSLEKAEKVGNLDCVALIRHFTTAPPTYLWRAGAPVMGNRQLLPGTAIATFVNGRYPNHSHGNHAAFYLGQVSDGIYVMDQWKNMAKKPKISKRFIPAKGKDRFGRFIQPSEIADAFSVIE